MNFTRAASLLTATALTATALTACGDDSEPTPSSSTASPIDRGTDSPSETSSDDTSDATDVIKLPAASKEQTKEGAIAFNRFYWKQVGEAYTTGNPYVLVTYTEGCAVCDNLADQVKQSNEKGIHSNKNPYSVSQASATERSDSGYRVELTLTIDEYHDVDSQGAVVERYAQQTITVVSDTRWTDGHWMIRDQVRIK